MIDQRISGPYCLYFFYSKIREELGLKPLPFEKITTSKPVQKPTEKSRVSVFKNYAMYNMYVYTCLKFDLYIIHVLSFSPNI